MDIVQLRLFVSLARNLHFGRTGVDNHLSPSAVSRHLQKLEDQLGHRLFERDNRSVSLTAEGEVFLDYARDVLERYEQLRFTLGQQSQALTGDLTLFASVTAAQSILPDVLDGFRADYPGIHIQLETGYAVNAIRRLWEGCDVAVAALPETPDERLERKMIRSIPIRTIAPRNAPDLEPRLEGAIDWAKIPLVLPASGQSRRSIDAWFRVQQLRPIIYAEVAGNEAILSLVALGCGVGFVPELVVADSPLEPRVRLLEGGPALEDFHVGFCTRRVTLKSSPVVRAFWEAIE